MRNCKIKLDLSKELLNCDLEEIQGIVYKCKQNEKELNHILLEVFKKLIPTFSQDIIAFTNISMLNKAHKDFIIQEYNKINNTSLNNFLKETMSMKNVIYTFSNILEPFIIKEIIETKNFGLIKNENIKEILIYSIN